MLKRLEHRHYTVNTNIFYKHLHCFLRQIISLFISICDNILVKKLLGGEEVERNDSLKSKGLCSLLKTFPAADSPKNLDGILALVVNEAKSSP